MFNIRGMNKTIKIVEFALIIGLEFGQFLFKEDFIKTCTSDMLLDNCLDGDNFKDVNMEKAFMECI